MPENKPIIDAVTAALDDAASKTAPAPSTPASREWTVDTILRTLRATAASENPDIGLAVGAVSRAAKLATIPPAKRAELDAAVLALMTSPRTRSKLDARALLTFVQSLGELGHTSDELRSALCVLMGTYIGSMNAQTACQVAFDFCTAFGVGSADVKYLLDKVFERLEATSTPYELSAKYKTMLQAVVRAGYVR